MDTTKIIKEGKYKGIRYQIYRSLVDCDRYILDEWNVFFPKMRIYDRYDGKDNYCDVMEESKKERIKSMLADIKICINKNKEKMI